MKKLMLVIVAAAFVSGFAACKKDYTCTCTITDSSGTIPTTTVATTIKETKKKATDACEIADVVVGTITTHCTLD